MIKPLWALARRHSLVSLVLVVAATAAGAKGVQKLVDYRRAADLREVAQPGDIRMISSTECIWCERANAWMTKHAIPFSECYIETDAACRAEYDRLGTRSTPTMVVRGTVQRGFEPVRVTATLAGRPVR